MWDDAPREKLLELKWLPRQDQLQEMLSNNINYTIQVQGFDGMLEFSGRQSWEQLWLAFVLKEKFNKVWNGEKWEAINAQRLQEGIQNVPRQA
jgi:hypothetical protein